MGVITEEEQDEGEEALAVMADSPEENCYSNIMMIQPRKKKTSRNKSSNSNKISKNHREPPTPTIPADETVVLLPANNSAAPGTVALAAIARV